MAVEGWVLVECFVGKEKLKDTLKEAGVKMQRNMYEGQLSVLESEHDVSRISYARQKSLCRTLGTKRGLGERRARDYSQPQQGR